MTTFRQWMEMDVGDELYRQKGIIMIPFRDVEQDATEGYYFDHGRNAKGASVGDLSKIEVGTKVADHSLNMTPYWVVTGVDEDKQHIYLKPIEPNPLVTKVGAGGKVLDDFDMEVYTGEYEKRRVDDVLKQWKAGHADSISDIAYVLLGTVPVNFGPNGAQGGWYNCQDWNSRGGQKGMRPKEIMVKDAETVKKTFKFSVPRTALDGTLDPGKWNNYVQGSSMDDDVQGTELDEEDFDDPQTCARMVLEHPMPAIKVRNAERLLDMYRGYYKYRKDQHAIYRRDNYDQEASADELQALNDKWEKGGYANKSILPLIHDTALKLAKVNSKKQRNHFDPYWYAKEKFIVTATQQNWDDVLEAYEQTYSKDNRRYVYDAYLKRKDKKKLKEMLDRETSAEAIKWMLEHALSTYSGFGYHEYEGEDENKKPVPSFALRYIMDNYDELVRKVNNATDKHWYEEDLLKLFKNIKQFQTMM